MNNRVILIIAGLAAPIAMLAIVTEHIPRPSENGNVQPASGDLPPLKAGAHNFSVPPVNLPPLDGNATDNRQAEIESMFKAEQERVRKRLDALEKMTPEDFAEDQKEKAASVPAGTPPLTLDKARKRTRRRLMALESMTASQWFEEQRQQLGMDTKTTQQPKEQTEPDNAADEAAPDGDH